VIGRAPTSADLLLDETARYAALTAAQEMAIATRAAAGSRKARHLLVLHSMRFTNSIARQYQSTGIPHCDVLSAAYTGLLVASARFDPTRGAREHRARRGRQR
jgi:DNA-directed RNA polymerase sigma subunit (sigma70/sigma32)